MFSVSGLKGPVLIEVKSKKGKSLSFTPDYMQRLDNYASLVNMPLLIAWKCYNFWVLFEAKHMQKAIKNFNISINKASQENLLGMLAGDIAYVVGPGAGIHLQLRKDKLIDVVEDLDGFSEEWQIKVSEVGYSDYLGSRRTDFSNEVISLLSTWDLQKEEQHSEAHINLSYVAVDGIVQFAHQTLVRLLEWESPGNSPIHWRGHLRVDDVSKNVKNFLTALNDAFQQKVVSHILEQRPQTAPEFLQAK